MHDLALPHGSTAAFYGDSLTSGFGASSPDARWSSLLCRRRGWHEVNPSIPGLGFVKNRDGTDVPQVIIDADPALILVTLGANDLLLVDSIGDQVASAILTDLGRLRAQTRAAIMVAMPFSSLDFRPPQLLELEEWLRAGAQAIGAVVIESDGWMAGRTDLTVDGIHFTDEGERRLAGLMDAAIGSPARAGT